MSSEVPTTAIPTSGYNASRCATCLVSFTSLSEMREHFQSAFHTQNVRLRVEGKAPLTKSQYAQGEEADEGLEKPQFACTLCKKTFRSIQTLQTHIKSTAHLMKKEQRILARDSEAASMLTSTSLGSAALGLHRRFKTHHKASHADPTPAAPKVNPEQREADVDEKTCLFCGLQFADYRLSLEHMKTFHGFTVPLQHRCKDVEGLLKYLARKINGCVCLVCGADSKSFVTLNGLRSHMQQVQHDYVVLSPEYEDFYEGELMDPEEEAPEPEAKGNQLVLLDASKTLLKRRPDGIQKKFPQESSQQAEQRRAITAASQEASAMILKERREAAAPERKKELNRQRQQSWIQNKAQMQLGVRTNKLHPKGYDGEGETN